MLGIDTFTLALSLAALMILLWITEWIPVYLTALLPILLGAPMGLLSPKELATCYGDANIFLFFGGIVGAVFKNQVALFCHHQE